MKAHLMHRDRDFNTESEPPPSEQALRDDLALDVLLGSMAQGDEFLFEVARKALLQGLTDPREITYRQEALQDCLSNPDVIRALYEVAIEAIGAERRVYLGFYSRSPSMILHRSVQVLELLLESLRGLRRLAEEHAHDFRASAFTRFFAMVRAELDDSYLARVEEHLHRLRFDKSVPVAARLGTGNEGTDYMLLPPPERKGLLARVASLAERPDNFTYRLPDRDEAGARALSELRDRGIHLVANAAGQSAEHVTELFSMLRTELAFYVGCLNLHQQLTALGEPTAIPEPLAAGQARLAAEKLYDPCLALCVGDRVVDNQIEADGKGLAFLTGANQGGKSTCLRSVGIAQLMMQCGMFVAAERFRADVRDAVFTHFKREEDGASMQSGKLDEELTRMSEIVDRLTPDGLLLCNESFAATNEGEGSEIARQIVRALTGAGVKVFFVTHLYELAHSFYSEGGDKALFLRAERLEDGQRTFRMVAGEPLPTSFGADVFEQVFNPSRAAPRSRR